MAKKPKVESNEGLIWQTRQMRKVIQGLSAENTKLRAALKPVADCVFNDNGDMTVTGTIKFDDYVQAYFILKGTE